jgi:lysophospholipase L1-like esterase
MSIENMKFPSNQGEQKWGDLTKELLKKNDFPTVVLFGDSITSQNGVFYPSSGSTYYESRGFFTWCNLRSNGHFDVIKEAGTGGDTTAMMLARIQADVIDYAPDWCIIFGGINDIYTTPDITSSSTIANLKTMYNLLRDNNIKIIICTVTPSVQITTASQLLKQGVINEFIIDYAMTNKDVILVDWFNCLADTDAQTINSSFSSDGTHPNTAGAWRMGKKMYECLDKFFNFTPNNILGKTLSQSNNLFTNPTLQGNTAGKATSWSFTGTTGLTYTKEYYDDGTTSFNEQCIVCDSALAAGTSMYQNVTAGYSAGDILEALVRIRLESVTAITQLKIYGIFTGGGDYSFQNMLGTDLTSSLVLEDAVYRTSKILVPSGVTNIRVYINATGLHGKIKMSYPTLRKTS